MINNLLLGFFLLIVSDALSQYNKTAGNIWIFGDHIGVDFNTEPPSAITNTATSIKEACASVADSNGQLLFYTNGNEIYNKNHSPMPNGSGLMGDSSSSWGAMIAPVLGEEDKYYLFLTDGSSCVSATDPKGRYDGLHYCIIDMTLDNGDGDVSPDYKNIYLTDSLSEKIIGIKHANNCDYWILVRKDLTNAFYAYLVTSLGISDDPIISTLSTSIYGGVGQIAANLEGDIIAEAISSSYLNSPVFGLVIYDFDASTGMVSNPDIIDTPQMTVIYGCCFSPDGKQLYYSHTSLLAGNINEIIQYDLQSKTTTSHAINVPSGDVLYHIKAASNDKLYFTIAYNGINSAYLHSIESPNNATNPDIQLNNIFIGDALSTSYGLPNIYIHHHESTKENTFIPSAFSPNSDGVNDLFYVRSNEFCEIEIAIYNRLGNLVYETKDMQDKWDGKFNGKTLSNQVFVYCITITWIDGEKEVFMGNLTLVR